MATLAQIRETLALMEQCEKHKQEPPIPPYKVETRIRYKPATSFYLIGKIEKNCWRHTMVDNLRSFEDVSEVRVFGYHPYTGPFFASCDHGCFHGEAQHGLGPDFGWCQSPNDELGCAIGGAYSDSGGWKRHDIQTAAFRGIKSADTAFAWVGDNFDTAYGSMIEIGYAKGLDKNIVVGVHPSQTENRDFWFMYEAATSIVVTQTPIDALMGYLTSSAGYVLKINYDLFAKSSNHSLKEKVKVICREKDILTIAAASKEDAVRIKLSL